ncbi:hypothetical protein pipiens_017477 [Culex pipiens pipiens]|uniref:Uncharacterized protein n=1 Tax=Culex pipiens pipiens TaxID=38569 RepID=A0ABD1CGC8_CULPP
MKLTLVLLLVGLVCAVYAQDAAKDAAKDATDKVKTDVPDVKDAVTTPDPKDAAKGAEEAAGKAKDAAAKAKDDISGAAKKLGEGFKLFSKTIGSFFDGLTSR